MNNELYHHGVSGMKWGKRNGPPYPLKSAGKASLAKQRKSSGRLGVGSSVASNKKSIKIKKDKNGRVIQVSGKINVNKKPSLSDLSDRARYGGTINSEDVSDPYVRKSSELKEYQEARKEYEAFEKSKDPTALDSPEALDAWDKLETAGNRLSRLIDFHSQFDPINSTGKYQGIKNNQSNLKDYSDLSKEEIAVAKQKAIREGNISEVQKNKNHYTDDEIRAVMTRHSLNTELKEVTAKNVKSGAEKVDSIISAIKKGTALAETGIDAYNVVAKVANSLGSDMPVLDGKPKDRSGSVADHKTLKQLESMINNPKGYSAKEIDTINDAYKKLLSAQETVRSEKNKNLTLEDVYKNKESYTKSEISSAMDRSDTLKKLFEATAAKQEEAESYANMKAEVFNKVKDLNKPLSELAKEIEDDSNPWWKEKWAKV